MKESDPGSPVYASRRKRRRLAASAALAAASGNSYFDSLELRQGHKQSWSMSLRFQGRMSS